MRKREKLMHLWQATEAELIALFGEHPDPDAMRRYNESNLGENPLLRHSGELALKDPGKIDEASALFELIKLGQFMQQGSLAGYKWSEMLAFAKRQPG